MYYKHHTRGIVISARIEGDSNRCINVFTEKFGLINAKVQGARNIHSKLRGGSQDFSLSEFSLVHGKGGWKVVSTRAKKNLFEMFRNSSAKLKIVGNVLNLVKKLTAEEAHLNPSEQGRADNSIGQKTHSSLFAIISNFFDFLEKAPHFAEASRGDERNDIALAECLTLTRILHSLGYMRHDPELSIPILSSEIEIKDLEMIAPRRSQMVALINESLKAT